MYASNGGQEGHSEGVRVSTTTFQELGPITLQLHGHDWLTVSWQSPSDNSVARHRFDHAEVASI